ncbi:hypothetical protein M5689_021467 [Euphorbia peplus]|nr:hypothetical protein M5689_021467 [Euphorbia peplus]
MALVILPATTIFPTTPPHSFPKFNLKNHTCRPFPSARARTCRIQAALSPQPPEQPDPPPPGKDPLIPQGIAATLSRFQDRVQIFFAVLFWMSLFFWASASDGKNNGSGRPNKGSRFGR